MKFKYYLKDRWYSIVLFFSCFFLFLLMLLAFKVKTELLIAILVIFSCFYSFLVLIDYFRKKRFYTELLFRVRELDKSYLVLETLDRPSFYEGELLFDTLYEINKSMNENVLSFSHQMMDFKEFIELWIHEVKIPISSAVLMAHNHKNQFDRKVLLQMKRIEDYVEQILYYVRSENAHKDYLINEVSLDKVIGNVALKNKDYFLEHDVEFIVDVEGERVYTDSKWLEFILHQIISNSLKYKRDGVSSYIHIYLENDEKKTTLVIEDNGIGISSSDLSRVFEKSFTGSNGRVCSSSTGMGLFIVKNLCEKLGHMITIDSKVNEYTKVFVTFYKNHYYDVMR